MEIKTKYNINDDVWCYSIGTTRIMSGKITAIHGNIIGVENKIPDPDGKKCMKKTGEYDSYTINVDYEINGGGIFEESQIFHTKDEAKNSLLNFYTGRINAN